MPKTIRVVIWNEFLHERQNPLAEKFYPDGIHIALADALRIQLAGSADIQTATLDESDHGKPPHTLEQTDVLLWWGHLAHDQVGDAVVARIVDRVWHGMGFIALHSAHLAKVFRQLMGTSCSLRWRDAGEQERLWIVDPGHPVIDGLPHESIDLSSTEMHGEFFDIPITDELVMISWFKRGEVFRSACTFRRGKGKIFYFRPGHEAFPIYHHASIQHVLANAIRWAAPRGFRYQSQCRRVDSPN